MTTQLSNVPNLGDWLDVAPWKNRAVVLIHIAEDDAVTQAHGVGEKRDLLCDMTGTMLAGWNGQWRTDVRLMTDDERDAVAVRVG